MAFCVISRLKDSYTVLATDVRRFSNFSELYSNAAEKHHMSIAPIKFKRVLIKGDNENLVAGNGYHGYAITWGISEDAWKIIQFQLKAFNQRRILDNVIGINVNSPSQAEACGMAFAKDNEMPRNYKFALGDKAADITDTSGNPIEMNGNQAEKILLEQVGEDKQQKVREEFKKDYVARNISVEVPKEYENIISQAQDSNNHSQDSDIDTNQEHESEKTDKKKEKHESEKTDKKKEKHDKKKEQEIEEEISDDELAQFLADGETVEPEVN